MRPRINGSLDLDQKDPGAYLGTWHIVGLNSYLLDGQLLVVADSPWCSLPCGCFTPRKSCLNNREVMLGFSYCGRGVRVGQSQVLRTVESTEWYMAAPASIQCPLSLPLLCSGIPWGWFGREHLYASGNTQFCTVQLTHVPFPTGEKCVLVLLSWHPFPKRLTAC